MCFQSFSRGEMILQENRKNSRELCLGKSTSGRIVLENTGCSRKTTEGKAEQIGTDTNS